MTDTMALRYDTSPSWVIVDRATGKAVMETFRKRTAEAVDRTKYDVVPILQYLVGINERIRKGMEV